MRFWDSSAIIPLLIDEARSFEVLRLHDEDDDVVAAAITPLEVVSSLWRRRHRGELSLRRHQRAELRFAVLSQTWLEVAYSANITEIARDLLGRHMLRSLDALQLASAISVSSPHRALPFVTLDEKLAAAARAEGFTILP
ncbi:MAG TPA: type II toxin-antitoxin system VapC family toxin [Thermoanaerobaculia bacterium]